MIRIKRTDSNFEREPLTAPFGFKGGYASEIWQTVSMLESESGSKAIGLGVQSVLWSDPYIFSKYSQPAGNCMMYMMTEYALKKVKEMEFDSPMDLLDQLLLPTYEYGKTITCNESLRMTFALNSMVSVDNAAWILYFRENRMKFFDDMIPACIRTAMERHNSELACIPLVTYGVSINQIKKMIEDGYFLLKIKIGADPEKDGDQDKMLEWDKKRLAEIHQAVTEMEMSNRTNRRILYYLDANGRYDGKERLLRLLEHITGVGALDRIALLEEPFPEDYKADVNDIPVRIAADESAHTEKDVSERIDMGYKAIALKPAAKTLSMSFRMARTAHDRNVPCFCADLTVNPILVDWNKNVASRLAPLPGMDVGVLESNGPQNYLEWQKLMTYHPSFGADWIEATGGSFKLSGDFYSLSGGIFKDSSHYSKLVG